LISAILFLEKAELRFGFKRFIQKSATKEAPLKKY